MKYLSRLLPYVVLALLLLAGLRWFQPAPRGADAFAETTAPAAAPDSPRYTADIRLDTLRRLIGQTTFADRVEVVPVEGAVLLRSRPDRMSGAEFSQVLLHGCPPEAYARLKPAEVLLSKPGQPEVLTLRVPLVREGGTHYARVPYDVLSSVFAHLRP
jgi:hypothetical protein